MKNRKARNICTVVLGLFLFFLCGPASAAGVIQLPQTGQTTCYDVNGGIVPCAGTAQDGYYRAGVIWPSPRFKQGILGEVDCMTDTLTGLMWPKMPESTVRMWPDALTYANNLTKCGHTDWRLPNILELESLVNADASDQSVWLNNPLQGFTNVQSSMYWSSTIVQGDPTSAWTIHMLDGGVSGAAHNFSSRAWPVRGASTGGVINLSQTGQSTCYDLSVYPPAVLQSCAGTGQDGETRAGIGWPASRFHDNINGTITDNLTGLIWLKDAGCVNRQTWENAFFQVGTYLQNGLCGLTDGSAPGEWRVPNRKELLSLTDFSTSNPSLQAGHPFQGVFTGFDYWSSTTIANVAAYGTTYNPGYGGLGGLTKLPPDPNPNDWNKAYVWPVYDSRKMLTVTTGSSGTVTPSCPQGCWYEKNATVPLFAVPDSTSIFSHWDCGGPVIASLMTSVTMDTSKTCTAVETYCLAGPYPVWIGFIGQTSLSEAYNSAQTGNGLKIWATQLAADIDFNRNGDIEITLQGGYDCNLFQHESYSILTGFVAISRGAVTFDNIIIM